MTLNRGIQDLQDFAYKREKLPKKAKTSMFMSPKDFRPQSRSVRDLRQWLRAFPTQTEVSKCLRWTPSLDDEDGTGIRVALVDSGLNWSHPMFEGAKIHARDFTGNGCLNDLTGHGTQNASLLVGQGNGWFRGLVPGCSLYVGKALSMNTGALCAGAVVKSIRWALAKGAHIIVLPFGRLRGSAIIAKEIRRAVHYGCTILAAAGNAGPDQLFFPAWLLMIVVLDPGRLGR